MQPVTIFKHDREGENLKGILPYLLNLKKNKAMNNDKRTTRENAMLWWNNLGNAEKIKFWNKYPYMIPSFSTRLPKDLTGVEIERLYTAEHPTETESKATCPHCGADKKIFSGLCSECGKFPPLVSGQDFDKEVEELKEQLNGATIEDVKKWKEDSLDLHSLRMSLNESSLNKYFHNYKERKFHDKVILSILEADEKKSQLEEQNKELREALEMVYKRLHIFGESNVWEDEDEMALHRAQKALTQ